MRARAPATSAPLHESHQPAPPIVGTMARLHLRKSDKVTAVETANLDDEARAELLCYLVVGHLVAMARTDTWLRTDHLVESALIWVASNGADCAWSERAEFARASAGLASELVLDDAVELARLFTDGWRLDYRSPVVQGIHRLCVAYLTR
jgi:hypothetical protein